MEKRRIDYRFTCKLLNICANKALMEDAMETRETILCAAELIRYIFDDSKTVIPLSKEVEAAQVFLRTFSPGDERDSGFELIRSTQDEAYIDHLALLSFIIHDVESSILLPRPSKVIYEIRQGEALFVDKIIGKEKVLSHHITMR